MKKKIVVTIFFFSILFIAFSDVLFMRKNQILTDWATDYIKMKTSVSPESGEAELQDDEARALIMYRSAVACAENLVSDITLVRDTPLKRTQIVSIIEFYGTIFTIQVVMSDNVVAYAAQSHYWSAKINELEMLSQDPLKDVETCEVYEQWRQEIMNEIKTLEIFKKDINFEQISRESPEELKNAILSYSIEEMLFFKQLFLGPWDRISKEKAVTLYRDYTIYMAKSNLEKASANLFALNALHTDQKKIDEVSMYFFGPSSEFVSPILLKIIVISSLSAAAILIGVLLLFYRKSRAVQVGFVTGVLAAIVSSGWVTVLWFLLAGSSPVYLGRHEIRDYRESAFTAFKTGIILFLTHYVFNAMINYSGITGEHGVEDLTELAGDTVMGLGVYIGLQVCILCLLSILAGLTTYMVLKAARMIREEGKQELEE
jgi:hypothetical protein